MTNEPSITPDEIEEVEMADAIDTVQDTLDKFLDAANVYAVYGEPVYQGETAIIPTAEVLSAMGFGVGSGYGRGSEENESGQGGGGGGGGGGRILSRPVAVVIASPEGVRVEPVVDVTKIALAALTAAGFMVGMLVRMTSSRRRMPNLDEA
jgi:uncharacterized spore protein YtfJ